MKSFDYEAVTSVEAAVEAAGRTSNAMYLGGGTTLLDLMKLDVLQPSTLLDIAPISQDQITETDEMVLIGAGAKMSDAAEHELILDNFPVVSQSLLLSASPQIRNMATIGGNLLQRTRCPYYRDVSFNCNQRLPGSGCDAIGGNDRMMAILGTSSQCIAAHPSDFAVALVALDAVVHLQAAGETRSVPIRDFYIPYGDNPDQPTVLNDGELIVAVELTKSNAAKRSHYLKVRDRASYEFALTSVAVGLETQGTTIRAAHLALGGVGTKPWSLPRVEQFLLGKTASRETFLDATAVALQDAQAGQHNGFKIELAKRALVRALETVMGDQP